MTPNTRTQEVAGDLVSGIRHGDITLDVPNVEAWLDKFDELVKIVFTMSLRLRQDAVAVFQDRSLGEFGLSDQIRAKMVARLGGADGSLALAAAEVAEMLGDIQRALRGSLLTHTESDEANTEILTKIAQAGEAPHE